MTTLSLVKSKLAGRADCERLAALVPLEVRVLAVWKHTFGCLSLGDVSGIKFMLSHRVSAN